MEDSTEATPYVVALGICWICDREQNWYWLNKKHDWTLQDKGNIGTCIRCRMKSLVRV